MEGITSDIIKLGQVGGCGGGGSVLTYPTNISNNTLKTKQTPDSCDEAKRVILFKKGDPKGIKNYRPIGLLSQQIQNIHKTVAI